MEPFIGTIMMFGGNFAPRGWATCNGQLLSIASHQALFSILGTTYGGDGRTTFALPDLRGRMPMHFGQGPGLSARNLGQKGGAEQVTLTVGQMPAHNHDVSVTSGGGDSASPADKTLATPKAADPKATGFNYASLPKPSKETLDRRCVSNAGSGEGHDNMSPFGCVNFIIALQGIFPSRS